METVNIELEVNDINIILQALAEIPYKFSVGPIEKIHAQTKAQTEKAAE